MNFYPIATITELGQSERSSQDDIIDLVSSEEDDESDARQFQLRQEIFNFSTECLTTPKESYAIRQVLDRITNMTKKLFRNSQTRLFGSQATGLAAPSSDLDVVVLDDGPQIFAPLESFTNEERKEVIEKLKKLNSGLELCIIGKGKIIPARIPILRIRVQISIEFCFKVDVSFGVRNAIHAVELIQHHLFANPVIQPLFLIVKTLLKADKLNEVYSGGISSFVLFNLVVAHLMMEGVHIPPAPPEGSKTSSRRYQTHHLRALLRDLDLPTDELLLRFLQRFGNWDQRMAVSILHNGAIPVSTIEDAIPGRILHVEDPQAPGRDATRGTFDMPRVLLTFQNAADKLEQLLSKFDSREGILDCLIPQKETLTKRPSALNSKRGRETTGEGEKKRQKNKKR